MPDVEESTHVARSWDARVKGASQKVTTPDEGVPSDDLAPSEDPASAPDPAAETAAPSTEVDAVIQPDVEENEPQENNLGRRTSDRRRDTVPTIPAFLEENLHEPVAPSQPPANRAPSRQSIPSIYEDLEPPSVITADAESELDMVSAGLSLAVEAIRLPVAIAERSTGLIRWTSPEWVDRFGEKDLLARHMPSATEFGESPLPPPGESWQRTRTLLFANGAEELAELVLSGSSSRGVDFVTVVALDKDSGGAVISDRQQVISIIDGAMSAIDQGVVAVLYVDLDRFKVVHDLVGNVEALRLLELVNHRIASTVRASDLHFRLASDEFVIVASELEHPSAAEELAERIRLAVATLADVGHDLALTASVGVALAEEGQTGDVLLSAAETAVYVAKGRGRNRIAVHDEELRTRTQRLMVVERQLRRAIDRRDVRFAYQPVIEIETGDVCGAEALLRLGGDVGLSAVEVVAAAEHSGLMGALGTLVFEGVNDQLSELLRNGSRNHTIMVNLSLNQMADDALLAAMGELVADPAIGDGRLAVEVPELVIRDHRAEVVKLASRIRPGFKLGVDGFGSGMLRADLLEGLPIDYLKLHRSVTTSLIDGGEVESERVRSLVAWAVEAGIDVVALGVETVEQAEALEALGCKRAQGFLYAGAVTSDSLLGLVESGITINAPGSDEDEHDAPSETSRA